MSKRSTIFVWSLHKSNVPSTLKKILPASFLALFLHRRTILPRSINWLQNIPSPRWILLDCSQEKEQLAQILEKAVAKDYEVALAGLQIDESILQTADEMKDLLAQIDDTKSPAFLLRGNVNTEETRNLLNEHGYTELILYDDSLQAGMQENGEPYICYGFFKQPVYYADYISQVVTAHTMMLASFSFSTIQNGTLQISDVERFMTLADDRKAANELRYVDLNSAFQAVADQNTTQQERQESYEKYEAEQEKRIQELEEEISAIYSRWDEY